MTTSIDKAALDLFKVYGFKQVTMDDIARRCGHSKKTIYELYESKEELIQSVLYYLFEKLEIRLNYIANQSLPTVEKLAKYYDEILNYCKSFHPIFLQSLKSSFPNQYKVYEQQVEILIQRKIISLYRHAKKDGIIISEINEENIGELHKEFFHFLVFKNTNTNVRNNNIETFKRRLLPSFRGMLTPAYISIFDSDDCVKKIQTIDL